MNPLNLLPNPFRRAIVSDPWQWDAVDVPEIHNQAFALCLNALEYVRVHGESTSVLLYGPAGSGKTHLLARFQAHLAAQAQTDTADAPPRAVFVSVRLQTSPQMIWRHLRHRFGSDLLRAGRDGRSQLEHILLRRLGECAPEITQPLVWLERLRQQARASPTALDELEDALEGLERYTEMQERDLLTVLGHLLTGRQRRDAGAWLRGESLPEDVLRELRVRVEQDEDPEYRARRAVLALCQLIGGATPVVFCFDQVEALQSHPQDSAGLFAFGQLVGGLRDETCNAVLISCILSTFLDTLNQGVIESDRHRLAAGGESDLKPLTLEQAKQLIIARLDARPEFNQHRIANRNAFWPLTEDDLRAALGPIGCTPRDLLSRCKARFEALRQPDAVPERMSADDFLAHALEERLAVAAAHVTVENTDQIVSHSLRLLLQLSDERWEQKVESWLRDVDLVFEGPRGRLSISLCNQRNMTSLAGRFRRLSGQLKDRVLEDGPRERIVLLRDARLPIGANATATRAYRAQLLRQGVHWVDLEAQTVAALDALRGLLSDAKAGDLANDGEAIAPATMQTWLLGSLASRLRRLHDLLDDLLPAGEAANGVSAAVDPELELCEHIGEVLNLHHLVSVEDVRHRLDREADEVEACARRHPERFGLLSGPPAVLFVLTPAPVGEES